MISYHSFRGIMRIPIIQHLLVVRIAEACIKVLTFVLDCLSIFKISIGLELDVCAHDNN